MPCRYETHIHTNQAGACGRPPRKGCIQKYMAAEYSGIIVNILMNEKNTLCTSFVHFAGSFCIINKKTWPKPRIGIWALV